MNKKPTLKLWNHLLKEKNTLFDESVPSIISENQIVPKKETIDTIIAYASSVKAMRTKFKDKIIVSLN